MDDSIAIDILNRVDQLTKQMEVVAQLLREIRDELQSQA